ncbi:MAG TPA: CHAT domain-containing protein [Chitinophagaceae bacterium]|nr:CHAT domain-containing protein [Chitinophagaceae bacterium]
MQLPPILFRLFLFIPALGAFILVASQDLKKSTAQIRNEYQKAFGYYEQANKLGNSPSYNEQTEMLLNRKALEGLKNTIAPLSNSPLRSDSLLFRIYFTIGELEHYFENYQEALDNYQKALTIQPESGLQDSVVFKPLLYSGIIYYNRGKLDSAGSVFLKADSIQQHYTNTLNESQRLYNTLGVLSYEAGDYRQAKNYFKKALELIKKDDPYYLDLKSNYLINLAQMQVKLQEYDEALANYEQLLPLNKNLDEVYHNMALIRVEQNKPAQAVELLKKVNFQGAKRIRLYNSFARAYFELNDHIRCRYYLNAAMKMYEHGDKDLSAYGTTLRLLGNLAAAEDSSELAIKYYTGALPCFYPAYHNSSEYQNPTKFSGIFSYINLYQVLLDKASAWHKLFVVSGKTEFGEQELNTYRSAYALLDYVLETYETDEARLFINKSRYRTHDNPIHIAFELYNRTKNLKYLEALYEIDQQNKASVLTLNMVRSRLLSNKPSDQEILPLKKQITRLALQAAATKDSTKLAELDKQILDLELNLAKLRAHNPGLTTLWQKLPTVHFIQNELLDKRSALLSYHLTADYITTTLITNKKFLVTRKKLPADFKTTVHKFISALQSPGSTIPKAVSNSLYHLVFDEAASEQPERLIIIPDDELTYLPFESLQDEQGKYAIQHFSIQYQYSTAFLEKQTLKVNTGSAISLAPFASGGAGSLSPLPFSREEIKDNRGLVYYDDSATKNVFLQKAGESDLVHLATHAKASFATGGTYLVFKKQGGGTDLLYEEEIYNMDLRKTKLVLLSACETGSGELMEGEGIMSLSRAFTYAGCDNIITSLWKADDQSTAYITKKIHYYLDKNYSIDEAICQAKLDLLKEEGINPRLKHPYYWSHLVFIGNYQPQADLKWKQVLVAAFAILVVLLLFAWNRSRRNS